VLRRRSVIAVLLALAACTSSGPDREGAVAVTAHLALRPAADGEAWPIDIAAAIGREQAAQTELKADGTPSIPTVPRITVERNPIYSDRFAPIEAWTIRAAQRETLVDAHARARSDRNGAGDIVPVYEHVEQGWELHFVHSTGGFELAPGAMAKVAPSKDGEPPAVALFLAEGDGVRFEQLTREHLGRRISMLTGDESLMIPVVRDAVPGGVVWITAEVDGSADQLLARLVR